MRPTITGSGAIHDQGFVPSAEKVPRELVAAVETTGVGPQQPFHAGHEVGLGGLDDQMKMIRHETIGMDLPTGLAAGLGEGVQKPLTIQVVAENKFATVTAVQDMVNRPGILNAKFACHAGQIKPQERKVSRLGTDPFA